MSTPVRIPTASASSRTREGSSSGSSGSPTSLTSSSASSSYDSPTHISTGRRQSFLNPLHAEQSFKIYDLGPADRAAPVVVLSASQVGMIERLSATATDLLLQGWKWSPDAFLSRYHQSLISDRSSDEPEEPVVHEIHLTEEELMGQA
ncbi:hypothetical protein SAICODRAFT_109946 [Saitoella complicata NRRL Y-17804]|uniref:uncharacterized protein n=1 Tax=Saitoella complicata (strain BCRC 22490 / CBS 7301 / JCM 7358 / NBRC 10748 / NRRL Y-17804) TaxID=698492 RepID=UPI000867778E|nr:uncharacterized protein SAICODRAFT_109946 [Saitoella complicata NRRL Y-17804]ODQ56519.1 hypothetical protein SAICODRAFT_109946 [Saitoella complicata NRRL Y-17804]